MTDLSFPIRDWPQFLAVALLVMIRVSGLMVFAPVFSSAAIAPRIKAGFVFAVTILVAPAVAVVPDAVISFVNCHTPSTRS